MQKNVRLSFRVSVRYVRCLGLNLNEIYIFKMKSHLSWSRVDFIQMIHSLAQILRIHVSFQIMNPY